MTTPLTVEELAAITARAAAATRGPWHVDNDMRDLNRWVISENGSLEANFGYRGNRNQDDAQFTAHARDDIPALLTELARLRAVEADLHGRLDDIEALCDDAESAALAPWKNPRPVPEWAVNVRTICRRPPAAAKEG
jgi:hypothetical protein